MSAPAALSGTALPAAAAGLQWPGNALRGCRMRCVTTDLEQFDSRCECSVAAEHEMSLVVPCVRDGSGYTPAGTAVEELLTKLFGSMSPHMRQLGFEVVSIQGGVCIAQLPYSEELVGDPATGVLHGGVVTSLLDTAGGAAVLSAVGQPIPLATLDLRIDYLRPSTPGKTMRAKVECYKKTYNIAFARGVAFELDESDPVASMAATYMLNTQITRMPGNVLP